MLFLYLGIFLEIYQHLNFNCKKYSQCVSKNMQLHSDFKTTMTNLEFRVLLHDHCLTVSTLKSAPLFSFRRCMNFCVWLFSRFSRAELVMKKTYPVCQFTPQSQTSHLLSACISLLSVRSPGKTPASTFTCLIFGRETHLQFFSRG